MPRLRPITSDVGTPPLPAPYSIAPSEAKPPLLTKITLPDGSSFDFTYYTDPVNGCEQGALRTVTLPTKGEVEYKYDKLYLPQTFCYASPFGGAA
jgi:hypothetical protein